MTAIYDSPQKVRQDMNEIATVRERHPLLDRASIARALVSRPRPAAATGARPTSCPCVVCRAEAQQLMIDQHEAFTMAEKSFRRSAAFATQEGLSPSTWTQHADRMKARALEVGRQLFR